MLHPLDIFNENRHYRGIFLIIIGTVFLGGNWTTKLSVVQLYQPIIKFRGVYFLPLALREDINTAENMQEKL